MGNPTRADAQLLGSEFAKSFRIDTVSGFVSAAGNGSTVITGLSGAFDAPMAAFVAELSYTSKRKITLASVTFTANRVQIANTDTSGQQIDLYWWNKV